MIKLPEGPTIGIVEALTALAFGAYKTPEQCKAETIARLERWGHATDLPKLLRAFEAHARGEDAGGDGVQAERLATKTGRPLDALIQDLKAEIAAERDAELRIGRIERRILDAAREGRVKLIAEKSGKNSVSPFAPIPAEQFEYRMAVHMPSGAITVSYDASMDDYVFSAGVSYLRVRIARQDVEALAQTLETKQHGEAEQDFSAPDWNCVQAIAWVFTRDKEAVIAKVEGAALQSTTQLSAWMVFNENPSPERTIEQAKDELRTALRRGDVSATGFRNGTGNREDIPATAWADLRFNDGADVVVESDPWRPGAVRWTDVRIGSARVLAAFPEPVRPTHLEIWKDDDRSQLDRVLAGIDHLIELSGGKVCGTKTDWHNWLSEGIAPEGFSLSTFDKRYWKRVPDRHKTQAPRKIESPFPKPKTPPARLSTSRTDSPLPASQVSDFGTRAERAPKKA